MRGVDGGSGGREEQLGRPGRGGISKRSTWQGEPSGRWIVGAAQGNFPMVSRFTFRRAHFRVLYLLSPGVSEGSKIALYPSSQASRQAENTEQPCQSRRPSGIAAQPNLCSSPSPPRWPCCCLGSAAWFAPLPTFKPPQNAERPVCDEMESDDRSWGRAVNLARREGRHPERRPLDARRCCYAPLGRFLPPVATNETQSPWFLKIPPKLSQPPSLH